MYFTNQLKMMRSFTSLLIIVNIILIPEHVFGPILQLFPKETSRNNVIPMYRYHSIASKYAVYNL